MQGLERSKIHNGAGPQLISRSHSDEGNIPLVLLVTTTRQWSSLRKKKLLIPASPVNPRYIKTVGNPSDANFQANATLRTDTTCLQISSLQGPLWRGQRELLRLPL